jgi:hypothetical protein
MGSQSLASDVDLAVNHNFVVGIVPLIVGVVVVVALVLLLVYDYHRRGRIKASREGQRRAGAWQTRQEHDQPTTAPDHGPGHQDGVRHSESSQREPDEWPDDGIRRLPHAMKGFGNDGTHNAGGERHTWDPDQYEN